MRKRRLETAALVLVCGGLAGLLIWSKLRLVSDLPRSAYAEPEELPEGGEDADGRSEPAQTPRTREDGTAGADHQSEN